MEEGREEIIREMGWERNKGKEVGGSREGE